MTYIMEQVTAEIYARVIKDAKLKRLYINPEYDEAYIDAIYGVRWVVDRDKDSYLIRALFELHDPAHNEDYIFYYKNQVYWLKRSRGNVIPFPLPMTTPTWAGEIWFDNYNSDEDLKRLSKEELAELKQAIKQAFSIYGNRGIGNEKYPYVAFFKEELEELNKENSDIEKYDDKN